MSVELHIMKLLVVQLQGIKTKQRMPGGHGKDFGSQK
jgi:hypothetical protein